MKRLMCIVLASATCSSYAAFERTGKGSVQAAMGGAGVAVTGNPWSPFSNPALITAISGRVVSVTVVPQQFGLSELSEGSLCFIEPTTVGLFGLSAVRSGFELYREMLVGLSFGYPVADQFSVGVTVTYNSVLITNYGSDWTIGIDAGATVVFTKDLHWGFALYNANAPAIGQIDEPLPQVYSTGLEYKPLNGVVVATDVVKDIRYPAELRFGLQYTIFDLLSFRGGTSLEPSLMTAGLGVHYAGFQFDYALLSHHVLGVTHQFSVSIWTDEF